MLVVGKRTLYNNSVFWVQDKIDSNKRYKTLLLVKWDSNRKNGSICNEISSTVVMMSNIILILGILAAKDLHLEQLDVKKNILYDGIEEEIYVAQPKYLPIDDSENMVCKLTKSLIGLNQAPRELYLKFDSFMHRSRYTRLNMDHYYNLKKFDSSYHPFNIC